VSGRRWAIQFVCLAGMVIMTAGASAERQFAVYSSGISVPLHAADGASAPETLQGISSSQWCFEAIGRQFTEPAHALSPPGNSADTCSPALLPAVPAAISLTLCGFLCVSFVRDRRAWLAVACALLWPGRAGIRAVPQLGHKLRFVSASARQATANLNPALPADSFQRAGNHEAVRYTGLLRHLEGIPLHNLSSIQGTLSNLPFPRKRESRYGSRRLPLYATGNYDIKTRQARVRTHSISRRSFVAQTAWSERVLVCPAGATGQLFILSSPAFIFSNLSRGPPDVFLA